MYAKLPYDAIRDLIPVTNLADAPFALFVHPSLPVKSVKELIALARKRPGEITYASFGVGSYPHFATEALNAMVGMRMNHVPYKGSAPAATALLSGEVMAGLDAPQSTLPHLRSGRLRALAMGSTQRIAIAPEIPTFAEVGLPGYTASAWFGLFLPAGTSKAIVDATHREGVRALQLPEIREPLQKAGFQVIGSTPEQFAQQVREDIARFTKIAREAGIKAE
jgi:tripartite-type tricarboxylate transporter receptor subunit TctC